VSERKKHLFQFEAGKIAEAARVEAAYHKQRADWWDGEFNQAVEKAQAGGLKLEKFKVTGGERAHMVIDPSLQSRINECEGRRTNHQQAADQLTIEAASYDTQKGMMYALDHEDIQHFRLAGGPRED
jgi:hypothetical protein